MDATRIRDSRRSSLGATPDRADRRLLPGPTRRRHRDLYCDRDLNSQPARLTLPPLDLRTLPALGRFLAQEAWRQADPSVSVRKSIHSPKPQAVTLACTFQEDCTEPAGEHIAGTGPRAPGQLPHRGRSPAARYTSIGRRSAATSSKVSR